jgi:hypothetical protein
VTYPIDHGISARASLHAMPTRNPQVSPESEL